MRKPVTKWNSDDVSEWVRGLGDWAKNYSVVFKKEVRFLMASIIMITSLFFSV